MITKMILEFHTPDQNLLANRNGLARLALNIGKEFYKHNMIHDANLWFTKIFDDSRFAISNLTPNLFNNSNDVELQSIKEEARQYITKLVPMIASSFPSPI